MNRSNMMRIDETYFPNLIISRDIRERKRKTKKEREKIKII